MSNFKKDSVITAPSAENTENVDLNLDSLTPNSAPGVVLEAACYPDEPSEDCSVRLESEHAADIAETLEELNLEEQIEYLKGLPLASAADALVEMEESARIDLLENIEPALAASLVSEMSPDDAADVLDELEEAHRDELLGKIEHEDAEEIRNLMSFDPDTAGGLMNTEIVILNQDLTVDEAIIVIRSDIEDKEIPYYAYIVDEGKHLTGVLSLRDLLVAPKGTVLADAIKGQNLITVDFNQDRSEVAHLISDYNFMAVPVVDLDGRLLGVVTHDDVMDVLTDMATEDMLGMVGAGQDESIDTPWNKSVIMRIPWLSLNMLTAAGAAFVIYLFEESIAVLPILAVLMPIVANQSGNTGQQALAIMIRQLATEKIDRKRAIKAITRELKITMCNFLLLAVLISMPIYFLTQSVLITAAVVIALGADMFLGSFVGATIPLILRKLGRDPAQASSIFLTAVTDSAGFFIILGLATWFIL